MADTSRTSSPTGKARQPITSHPLFPPIVVLWTGALFGLASVALRPAFESLVLGAGIDRVIPMAAPPLGTTFRILLALLMTGVGCLVGLVVAQRVAKPRAQPSARRRPSRAVEAESPVTLFGAGDEDEPEEEVAVAPVRRRQRGLVSEEFAQAEPAPLPGSPQILSVADLELDSFDQVDEDHVEGPAAWKAEPVAAAPAPARDPFISDWSEADHFDSPDGIFDRPLARSFAAPEEEAEQPAGKRNRLFEAYARGRRRDGEPVASESTGPITSDGDIPTPGFVSLPSMAELTTEAPFALPVAELAGDEPATPEAEVAPATSSEAATPAERGTVSAAERIATAPLADLSHVELLERLALALERRRAADRAAAAQAAEPSTATTITEPPLAAEPAPSVPFALRPVPLEPADDQDEALPAYLPPRQIRMSAVTASEADEVPEKDDVLAAGYSSLRNLTRAPHRPVPLRSEAEHGAPIVAFPGQPAGETAPPEADRILDAPRAFDPPRPVAVASDETERALKAALATLQRMSGAA